MQKVLLVAGVVALAGCGEDDAIDAALPGTDSGGGLDAPGVADAGAASTTMISASAGGTATSLDGRAAELRCSTTSENICAAKTRMSG